MASLSFLYSSMNSGKTLDLIKTYYNFVKTDEHNNVLTDNVICLTSNKDIRHGEGVIASRPLKTKLEAIAIDTDTDIFDLVVSKIIPQRKNRIDIILVDEAQFFTKKHIRELAKIVDTLDIEVMCYGLRTNFKGELFDGSAELLAISDKLREIKNRCFCGKKATMNLMFDENRKPIIDGETIQIGAENKYISLCRKHFKQFHQENKVPKL